MKQKTGKPKYIRHFVKAFIPCMIAAVLIGMVGTAGLYGIRYKTVTTADNVLFTNTEQEFHDISQMTPEEICEILARNARVGENDPVDRAFLLEGTDTGERYDSAAGLYANCQVKWNQSMSEYYTKQEAVKFTGQQYLCFVCSDEAYQAINEKLAAIRYENRRCKDKFRIHIKEIYVRKESRVFQPGIVEFVRIPHKSGSTETIDSLDLTPQNSGDLMRLTVYSNHLTVSWTGSPEDSQALARVRTLVGSDFSSRALFPKRGEPLEVNVSFIRTDGDWDAWSVKTLGVDAWCLREVTYYHFWQDTKEILLKCYAILLFLTVLTSAVIAIFTTMHSRKIWEMEQYRRDLTNTLAHDLRTPLTAIVGYMENLRNAVNPEKQDYYMDAIQKNTEYMDKMISDVLELSVLERTQKTQIKPVDLMQLFREAFAQYEPQLESRRITLRMKGECCIQADPRMMAQMAANLVSNAVRYTSEGGEITVSGSSERLQITNTCYETLDAAKLAEPFAKSDTARSGNSGSGLGLTIVRQIMELHGFKLLLHQKGDLFSVEIRFR